MSIKGGNTVEVLIAATDTTLINPTLGRIVITSAILSEQSGAEETIELFISTSAVSAGSKRLGEVVLPADDTQDPIELADRGVPSGSYLIGKGAAGGLVTAYITYTQYTGSS